MTMRETLSASIANCISLISTYRARFLSKWGNFYYYARVNNRQESETLTAGSDITIVDSRKYRLMSTLSITDRLQHSVRLDLVFVTMLGSQSTRFIYFVHNSNKFARMAMIAARKGVYVFIYATISHKSYVRLCCYDLSRRFQHNNRPITLGVTPESSVGYSFLPSNPLITN